MSVKSLGNAENIASSSNVKIIDLGQDTMVRIVRVNSLATKTISETSSSTKTPISGWSWTLGILVSIIGGGALSHFLGTPRAVTEEDLSNLLE